MDGKIPNVSGQQHSSNAHLSGYILGFVLSIVLTLIPYTVVVKDLLTGWQLTACLVIAALLQLFVQLKFFIHLGHETGTQWNKIIFIFMTTIVAIIVGGSLWIMQNLDYQHGLPAPKDGSKTETKMDDYPHYDRNFTPSQTNDYIIQDEGFNR